MIYVIVITRGGIYIYNTILICLTDLLNKSAYHLPIFPFQQALFSDNLYPPLQSFF